MDFSRLPDFRPSGKSYVRWKTREVRVGEVGIGGDNPIRVQSMTTTDTMDTEATIAESIRMIEAGCELVRITAPSKKEAENLKIIKEGLRERGYSTPLVADIHFTPNAAEIAARIVEKVRVNPGNYADKKKFANIEYNDETYQAELDRIRERFTPLVEICKEHGTAMRIGTNHGSLSDRIMSRYGDTPHGMVESAMEFVRICRDLDYHELILSMKASNTQVMVQAYRLLVATMKAEGMNYPLHLGVTEAGDGEDGRIKSAVGIGTLLEDGLGDTVRVSLTEPPEAEIPVAKDLVKRYVDLSKPKPQKESFITYSPFDYKRSESFTLLNIGGKEAPVVLADLSDKPEIKPSSFFPLGHQYSIPLDKWNQADIAADFIYLGRKQINFEIPGQLGILVDAEAFNPKPQHYPVFNLENFTSHQAFSGPKFLRLSAEERLPKTLENHPEWVIVLSINQNIGMAKSWMDELRGQGIQNPIILEGNYADFSLEETQLYASTDFGSALLDGFGDGVWLKGNSSDLRATNQISFGILQATRVRISKTEYISCPSCGRTLFDLQETTAKIRRVTHHLKGVKIGIMGCIVNGPGEMADADYGYVGTGVGKITLYKEKEVVKRNIPSEEAVDELIELIKEYGDWVEPEKVLD